MEKDRIEGGRGGWLQRNSRWFSIVAVDKFCREFGILMVKIGVVFDNVGERRLEGIDLLLKVVVSWEGSDGRVSCRGENGTIRSGDGVMGVCVHRWVGGGCR